MRKALLILVLVSSLICPVSAQQIYSKATPSDLGIYNYFSKILKDSTKNLQNFLDENRNVNSSLNIYRKVLTVEKEYIYYKSFGVKTNLSIVIPPFLSLTKNIATLRRCQVDYLRNSGNVSLYLKLKKDVSTMSIALENIRVAVKKIGDIELYNGNRPLKFDVKPIEREIARATKLLSVYKKIQPKKPGLYLAVSNTEPYLFQPVYIFVYRNNVTNVSLFIDNSTIKLSTSVLKYNFTELGKHKLYAVGMLKNATVKSNVVVVNVTKIPTYLTLYYPKKAHIFEVVWLRPILFDAYGKLLRAKLEVYYNGSKMNVTSNTDIPLTSHVSRAVNVLVKFYGNKTLRAASAQATIKFLKFPVRITLSANKTRVLVGKNVTFSGTIFGVNRAKIYVLVNSVPAKVLSAKNSFNFTLRFEKPGKYKIEVYYPGDPIHSSASSNVLTIGVHYAQSFNIFLVVLAVVIAGIAFARLLVGRRGSEEESVEKVVEIKKPEVKETVEEVEKPVYGDLGAMYRKIFKKLVEIHGLNEGLTPRELSNILGWEDLKILTKIHEKIVYGKMKPSMKEIDEFMAAFERLSEKIGI